MNFPDHETLLSIGVTLIVMGIVLRGLAAQGRRDLARRKQHRLDDRKSSEALLSGQLDRLPTWLERNSRLIANAILLVGVMVTIAACCLR